MVEIMTSNFTDWINGARNRHYENTYLNILEISPPKTESFQIKIQICFNFLLKTLIVSTRKNRLGEAVRTCIHNLFLSRNKKNKVYPCKPSFTI